MKKETTPREGELYKKVIVFGRTFSLYYGYYEDRDRRGPPDVIYPDFLSTPVYTDEGAPFVTLTQDACPHYSGNPPRSEDSTCGECTHLVKGTDWFGLCSHEKNKNLGGK